MGSTAKSDPRARASCPICDGDVMVRNEVDGSTQRSEAYPFCSERCRLIDLGRWLDEDYRIPDKPSDT